MKLEPEGSFDCLGMNTLTHLPHHFLRLPLTHSALLSLMSRSPSFPPQPANAPLVSRRPLHLQQQQRDGDEPHLPLAPALAVTVAGVVWEPLAFPAPLSLSAPMMLTG